MDTELDCTVIESPLVPTIFKVPEVNWQGGTISVKASVFVASPIILDDKLEPHPNGEFTVNEIGAFNPPCWG